MTKKDIKQNKFAFFANFAETIQTLPEEMRAEAYRAVCEYGIYGVLPENIVLRSMCLMAQSSIFKNEGGAPIGNSNARKTTQKQPKNNLKQPKTTTKQPTFQETETETEAETRNGNKKQETEAETETPVEFDPIQPAIDRWVAYKRERGQTYKPIGYDEMVKKLHDLSGGDLELAEKIVSQSIANNWSGLFGLKQKNKNDEAFEVAYSNLQELYNDDDGVFENVG